jgi:molybdopterin-containing oxidoreductase family iron-sulfur binding subunit
MEIPTENPQTVHMPMMCQHCNHAPCETVCPVAATAHSNEGLNNMAYNRCIGTRYCANNCPYKVRRFNWFNYVTNDKFSKFNPSQDETMRMVLNPDVTVRTRGVMEKCSMCQQRIQAGKIEAKKKGEVVSDGLIVTACAEACPTHAIVFGDLNDTTSENTSRAHNNRSYHALEEVGIQPNIYYMTKVRNIETGA